MDLIEAFLTIGFRSPYCQYEVVDSYSFNETRGEGRGSENLSVRPTRHEEVFETKDLFMKMIKSIRFL